MKWFPTHEPAKPVEPLTAEEVAACHQCGHIVVKNRMQTIPLNRNYWGHPTYIYFCNNCPVHFHEMTNDYCGLRYWKRVEVDKYGKPLHLEE